MRNQRVWAFLILALASASPAEVPDFPINPKQTRYRDFSFAVRHEKRKLTHSQFEIYRVLVSIIPGKRKELDREAYIEVWNDKEFVYSSTIPKTTPDSVSVNMRKTVPATDSMLFSFDINPKFVKKTWFNYQILRDDGSVEMNCIIHLDDFLSS